MVEQLETPTGYGVIECENGKHGSVTWFGEWYRCEACGRLYDFTVLGNLDYGVECECGEVLMPVPWALDRYFSLRPACEMCVQEKTGKPYVKNHALKRTVFSALRIIKERFIDGV